MQKLDNMALFVEVVKARGFRQAAEAMDMPLSTLSRRIADLERSIGLRLMNRTTRRLELTEAGNVYFERCVRIVEDARQAHEQLDDFLAKPKGLLRISLPVDFATIYLSPIISGFAQRYPDIEFELNLTSRRVDLIAEPYDLAIRMGRQPNSSLVASLLATIPRYLFASPDYLLQSGTPTEPEHLARFECLRMGTPQEHQKWTLRHDGSIHEHLHAGKFSVNSMGMLRTLALHDQGIAALPEAMVKEDVAAGTLTRVLPGWELTPVQAYAVTETRLVPAKTRCFIEYLRDALNPESAA